MKRLTAALTAVAIAAAALSPAAASAATYSNGTATATFAVSLTLVANCTISANALNFGSTGVLTSAVTGSTTLAVTCTNTTPYNVGLDAGTVSGSSTTTRLMAGTTSGNTSSTVSFKLYQDSAYSTNWGNTQGTDTLAGTGTGSAQTLTVYGKVPAQTTPAPDTYTTTVTATVYF
ncbi:spore coat U domain-containing protein [Burkholderia sp. BCC1977]|uniref:Csu type fimbrial protein n=1 Tax=Burkholderia sp. BCC1977 TaxID=2817440 RepID=UPI002ABD579E|nr:spore coat U domain-containing protein [Burkholderia sp. BCC1977]